jgi:hypothetical protein
MVQKIKGEKRGLEQPVGFISPFEADIRGAHIAIDAYDKDAINDSRLRDLAEDPGLLTNRIGALAFMRGPASKAVKLASGLPDSIVPLAESSNIQIFSTTGNHRGETLSRLAAERAVRLVMTSANVSGQPEIVTVEKAWEFANASEVDIPVVQQYDTGKKPQRPRGSYPTFGIKNVLTIIRPGFIEIDLLRDIFSDYEVHIAAGNDFKPTLYPENTIRRQDLPKEHRHLQQADLRDAILENFSFRTRTNV